MRRRVLTVYGITLLIFALGFLLGAQVFSTPVRAQTSTYLSATPITSTLHFTQVWMVPPFCIRTWWGPTLCSEAKGDELHIGAGFKLDLPGPAWLALEGKDAQGRWTLHSIAKTNDQSPGANFVSVTGPTLVTVLNSVTPSPVVPPPASVTLSPPFGATATPTARVTPTPPPPQEEASPTPTVPPLLTPTVCYPSLNIYGYDERVGPPNVPSVRYYVGSGCGALVVQLEGPAVITAYNRMLDSLLEENLRRLVQRCLARPQECEQLLTPEAR